MSKHHSEKHYVKCVSQILKCKICGKEFDKSELLNKHLQNHSDKRPYVCHLCSMSFLRAAGLKRHAYSHSGERPIHCDICGKGLYSKVALQIHMVVF
jgi:uncharacterized Zn-finger protein